MRIDLDSEVLDDKKTQKAKRNTSDIIGIIKMIMENHWDPVIVFSFSKKDCENYSIQLAKIDFTTPEEKKIIEEVFFLSKGGKFCSLFFIILDL